MESLSLDDSGPLPVHRPATVAEMGGLVADAARSGRGVYPVGGRTTLDVGLPPAKPGVALDTTALDQVVDYPARDMTITVRAGMTVAALQAALAAEGQWLPVDVPAPDRATIGGAVALNLSGPRRYGYGTLRDYVIGISFLTDEGVEVKAGGRVVKNVAGYDLMKLQVGAAGTLGVVTQLTLKVKPKPEAAAAATFRCETADLGRALDLLHGSKSRPAAVELFNAAAAGEAGVGGAGAWAVAVGFEEKAATVDWQLATLLAELKALPVRDVTEARGDPAAGVWRAATELQSRPASRVIWKANVLPSKVAGVVEAVTRTTPYLVHAEALNGIVWVHAPETFPTDPAAPELAALEQQVTAGGGNFMMRRCPTGWKRAVRVWGRPTGDRDLMRHVKRTLDPNDVFNPGRLFGTAQ